MTEEKKNQVYHRVGTIVYYGPDNKTVTKIVASVFNQQQELLGTRTWQGDGILESQQVVNEIGVFLKSLGAEKVVVTEEPVGCPHVEGVDYPKGEDCPYCPYWSKKTRKE